MPWSGGDTKALFISFSGFTSECLESLHNQSDERVVLLDGFDLRCVLNCDIGFDVLLVEKQAENCLPRGEHLSVPVTSLPKGHRRW